jgi:formylglycine-generating enzyme required for sulfatase activity
MLTSKEGPVFGLPAELDIEFQPEGGVDRPVSLVQLPSDIQMLLFQAAANYQDQLGLYVTQVVGPSVSADGTNIFVQADGRGLKFQWMLNGVAIAGGTSSQLRTQGLQSGTYTVEVSNSFGGMHSSSFQYPPSPIGAFALVTGGTLPASSALGAVPVDTFYIGKTEVTWGEWQTVRAWAVANGYTDLANVGAGVGDNYPVSNVSWYDVVKWCNARSQKEGKTPVYTLDGAVYKIGQVTSTEVASANGYRLPSEKEWEFAARGGTQTNGYTYSGSNYLSAVGWYGGNSGGAVEEVGKKLANELGIYDMSGNLWEWSGSWYPGAPEGSSRVLRGGDWYYSVELYCTVAFRTYDFPEYRNGRDGGTGDGYYGFRVALNAAP